MEFKKKLKTRLYIAIIYISLGIMMITGTFAIKTDNDFISSFGFVLVTKIVNQEDFQWIWAVLSGFDKNIELSEVLKYDFPYANGYKDFSNKPLTLQHPLSKIEIVPWDSSLTLFLSEDKELVSSFMHCFSYSENLEDYLEKTLDI